MQLRIAFLVFLPKECRAVPLFAVDVDFVTKETLDAFLEHTILGATDVERTRVLNVLVKACALRRVDLVRYLVDNAVLFTDEYIFAFKNPEFVQLVVDYKTAQHPSTIHFDLLDALSYHLNEPILVDYYMNRVEEFKSEVLDGTMRRRYIRKFVTEFKDRRGAGSLFGLGAQLPQVLSLLLSYGWPTTHQTVLDWCTVLDFLAKNASSDKNEADKVADCLSTATRVVLVGYKPNNDSGVLLCMSDFATELFQPSDNPNAVVCIAACFGPALQILEPSRAPCDSLQTC